MRRWHNSGLEDEWTEGQVVHLVISRPKASNPLTASLRQRDNVIADDGEVRYAMTLSTSEDTWVPWRDMRDYAFTVDGGLIVSARRANKRTEVIDGSERSVTRSWTLEVKPDVPDGSVTVTLEGNRACNERGALCSLDGRRLSEDVTLTLGSGEWRRTISIADTMANEEDGVLLFTVSLSDALPANTGDMYEVTFRTTERGSAREGLDFLESGDVLVVFSGGVTSQVVGVRIIEDEIDDDEETVIVEITDAMKVNVYSGKKLPVDIITDGEAIGTIRNSGLLQKAWIARFGRTVAGQAVDTVGERLSGRAGTHVTLGGVAVSGGTETDIEAEADRGAEAMTRWLRGEEEAETPARGMTARELLLGSAFSVKAGSEPGGPGWSAWGRFSTGGFDAEVDRLTLSGTVTSGFLGADVESGSWLAGAAIGLSEGEGSFGFESEGDDDGRKGEVESTLLGVYPYVRYAASERLSLWAMGGIGDGTMTVRADGANALETGLSMHMGAAGASGALLEPPPEGGLAVKVRSDALFARMKSERLRSDAGNLGAAEADVSRVRLIVEGSRAFALGEGASLTPALELGLRHDGGDAETGTGIEVGGRISYTRPGVAIEGGARTLVAHEDSIYEEWGASASVHIDPGASGRGLSLTVMPTWGNAGSATGQLWGVSDARGLAPEDEFEPGRRLEAELGYGLGAPLGVVIPFAGVGLAEAGERTLRLGARWALGLATGMHLEGVRTERAGSDAAHRVGVTPGPFFCRC